MAKEYTPLVTHPLSGCSNIIDNKHLPEVVYLDDTAADVMIDFTVMRPGTIGPERPMYEARKLMEDSNIHICLVTDDEDCVLGLIALQDILGSKPVKLLQENRAERKMLKVKQLMIATDQLNTINYQALNTAQVGHIIATLHEINQHYVLVTDTNDGQQVLRGMFIDSQISKQLGCSIRSNSGQLSIAELQHKLSD